MNGQKFLLTSAATKIPYLATKINLKKTKTSIEREGNISIVFFLFPYQLVARTLKKFKTEKAGK